MQTLLAPDVDNDDAASLPSVATSERRVIANPAAVLLLLSCLARIGHGGACSASTVHRVQAAAMRSLVALVGDEVSVRNREALASVGAVAHVLALFGQAWLAPAHVMRDATLAFVEVRLASKQYLSFVSFHLSILRSTFDVLFVSGCGVAPRLGRRVALADCTDANHAALVASAHCRRQGVGAALGV